MSEVNAQGVAPGVMRKQSAFKPVVCHTSTLFNDGIFQFDFGKTYGVVDETDDNISIRGASGGYVVLSKDVHDPLCYRNWFRPASHPEADSMWICSYDTRTNQVRILPGTISNMTGWSPQEGLPSSATLHFVHEMNTSLSLGKTNYVKCKCCGKFFELTDENRQWYIRRELEPPKRCAGCRIKKGANVL